MSAPFVVSIPHRLGKDEAVRRLKTGLGSASSNYAHLFAIEEEIWTGEHLQFRVRALGQVASGTIDVAEEYVTLQVFLPWLLAKAAALIQPLVRKEGTLLLEKKGDWRPSPCGARCRRAELVIGPRDFARARWLARQDDGLLHNFSAKNRTSRGARKPDRLPGSSIGSFIQ
jgi:Putative polyhydroxyalkanoic acid system protein (PHA_gran_rgn)